MKCPNITNKTYLMSNNLKKSWTLGETRSCKNTFTKKAKIDPGTINAS